MFTIPKLTIVEIGDMVYTYNMKKKREQSEYKKAQQKGKR